MWLICLQKLEWIWHKQGHGLVLFATKFSIFFFLAGIIQIFKLLTVTFWHSIIILLCTLFINDVFSLWNWHQQRLSNSLSNIFPFDSSVLKIHSYIIHSETKMSSYSHKIISVHLTSSVPLTTDLYYLVLVTMWNLVCLFFPHVITPLAHPKRVLLLTLRE